jgi:hypothetical protein
MGREIEINMVSSNRVSGYRCSMSWREGVREGLQLTVTKTLLEPIHTTEYSSQLMFFTDSLNISVYNNQVQNRGI